jgi:enediyne biosynthesis protein E3
MVAKRAASGCLNFVGGQVPHALQSMRRILFRIPAAETTFARRGFHNVNHKTSIYLEQVGRSFVYGYDAALANHDLHTLTQHLDGVEGKWRGFAFEGAAMALTLIDQFVPWKTPRLQSFLAGPATSHVYMVHVGVGWTIARLIWLRHNIDGCLAQLDSLLRWLAVDGYGFHEGYFHWSQSVVEQRIPKRVVGYARRAFDQGLGRSLWFVDGADVERIPDTIAKFDLSRRADLWSGVGLACAYAGGVSFTSIQTLKKAAGSYSSELAQGAAFAAKARQRAGNYEPHTDLACRIFCGLSADNAADITDKALIDLPIASDNPTYELWRERIRMTFTGANPL